MLKRKSTALLFSLFCAISYVHAAEQGTNNNSAPISYQSTPNAPTLNMEDSQSLVIDNANGTSTQRGPLIHSNISDTSSNGESSPDCGWTSTEYWREKWASVNVKNLWSAKEKNYSLSINDVSTEATHSNSKPFYNGRFAIPDSTSGRIIAATGVVIILLVVLKLSLSDAKITELKNALDAGLSSRFSPYLAKLKESKVCFWLNSKKVGEGKTSTSNKKRRT